MRRKTTQQVQADQIDFYSERTIQVKQQQSLMKKDRLVRETIDREPNGEVGNKFNKCTKTGSSRIFLSTHSPLAAMFYFQFHTSDGYSRVDIN